MRNFVERQSEGNECGDQEEWPLRHEEQYGDADGHIVSSADDELVRDKGDVHDGDRSKS
jgi:hypothetical protein